MVLVGSHRRKRDQQKANNKAHRGDDEQQHNERQHDPSSDRNQHGCLTAQASLTVDMLTRPRSGLHPSKQYPQNHRSQEQHERLNSVHQSNAPPIRHLIAVR